MLDRDGYPAGIPCWIDLVQPDFDATTAFYGGLFGWDFQVRTPDGAPLRYAYALVGGRTVGGIGTPAPGEQSPSGWTSYVAVDSADRTAAAVEANGGTVLAAPSDVPGAGRVAVCADPDGAVIGLWQAAENRGAQAVNEPGTWVFSGLGSVDPAGAERFYGAVFGWGAHSLDMGGDDKVWFWAAPGYGEFLAGHDPEVRAAQEAGQGPDGFSDAVALLQTRAVDDGPRAQWIVTFGVADADAAIDRATDLGATVVVPPFDTAYTREGVIRDPQGAELIISQYRPPTGG